jgi:hypothetical protein
MKTLRQTRALPFREGTWFAIPLEHGGYSVGRVARHSPKGEIILAYFFGPKHGSVPRLKEIENMKPDEAITVMRVSEIGLIDGSWPIIGHATLWERESWPMPMFIRRDDLLTHALAWRVVYDNDDPSKVISEEPVPYGISGLEPDRFCGHIAAQTHLSQLLQS